jgi:Ca2+-binding RTX toxin-like protein
LSGGYGTDKVLGQDGNDTIESPFGDDVLDGGAGSDWVNYYWHEGGDIYANLDAGSAYGWAGTQQLVSIENLSGPTVNNYGVVNATFIGDAGPNVLLGGFGDDTLRGGGGGDRLRGIYFGGDSPDGSDSLYGEAGNDSLDAVDTVSGNDLVNGGEGFEGGVDSDNCSADPGDVVVKCES